MNRKLLLVLSLVVAASAVLGAQPAPGTMIVPPLTGPALTNQQHLLATLRKLPKEIPSEARTFTEPGRTGQAIRYRFFRPKNFDPATNYPLVLVLHGGAPRRQFEHLLEGDLPGLAYGIGRFVSDDVQTRHPAFVVAPWSGERGWDEINQRLVVRLLPALQKEFRIDARRIYVTGQSMGGYGTWSLITAHPQIFAAAVLICGGGDPALAHRAKSIPMWAFHGTADGVVTVNDTRTRIHALTKAGAKPIYWEYQGATHAQTAERAYCEPMLADWLFTQQK